MSGWHPMIPLPLEQIIRDNISRGTGSHGTAAFYCNLVPRARDLQGKNRELWDNP